MKYFILSILRLSIQIFPDDFLIQQVLSLHQKIIPYYEYLYRKKIQTNLNHNTDHKSYHNYCPFLFFNFKKKIMITDFNKSKIDINGINLHLYEQY
ncbi:hypothetical protein pb186bvf_021166 [Paramecium bursaria]